MRTLSLASLLLLAATTSCKREDVAEAKPGPGVKPEPVQIAQDPKDPPKPIEPAKPDDSRMYTTYFYTAGEAVIHGYEDKTRVRIVSITDPGKPGSKAGTIWEGTVGIGESKLIPTGTGVFGLLSDKKAAILVGTPSSCAVVGYFVKDQEGRYRSNRFFTQLPSSAQLGGERLDVWAYEPATVTIRVPKTQEVLATGKLDVGGRLELSRDVLSKYANQMIEVVSEGSPVATEVYYDQGFIVPSTEGRGAGKAFYTFVGALTAGSNDLDVVARERDTKVTIKDLDTKKELWHGSVKSGGIHSLELKNRYVRVQTDQSAEVMVAAFDHLGAGYAEQHFATGREGGGIDNDFAVTTSGNLWLFSYFADNPVTITNSAGKTVYEGKLGAGSGHELTTGLGLFRVHAGKGLSVMGGANACGADYSPAAGMFAVDEGMLKVIQQVTEARIQRAAEQGITLTPQAAAAAPISGEEWTRYAAPAKAAYRNMSLDEANQRKAELAK